MSLDGSGNLASETLLLADIRDKHRIEQIMKDVSPEIVFHAAALKHLPLLERFPAEAQKTNVLGTSYVLDAAIAADVEVFVNVSTDKAADPTSILGYSKLITERLTAAAGKRTGKRYMSVRFGNVLGSRGSVIEAFRFQIAKGGPVTVTDENVTRYFMTVSEAVHLVLQAAVLGRESETLILDMGSPVKILDVAKYMIQRSGREIPIVFTGLRPGEKLDEILIGVSESVTSPDHPLISHTMVAPLSRIALQEGVTDETARSYLTTAAKSA
jgi:dTDP-glucose 4,6-dehydratase